MPHHQTLQHQRDFLWLPSPHQTAINPPTRYDKLANTHSTDCLVGGCDWFDHPCACYTITAVPAVRPLLLATLYCCFLVLLTRTPTCLECRCCQPLCNFWSLLGGGRGTGGELCPAALRSCCSLWSVLMYGRKQILPMKTYSYKTYVLMSSFHL